MKYILTLIVGIFIFSSCEKEDGLDNNDPTDTRTVVVYIAGENNLTGYVQMNMDSMASGSRKIAATDHLIAYVDRAASGEMPYVARISNGEIEKIDSPFSNEDTYSSDPEQFYNVLHWITTRFPADSYGLVLWGHAEGWIIQNDSVEVSAGSIIRRAYGHDSGNNTASTATGKWLNIPSMAMALSKLPVKWDFIFSDCCCMQCVEVAYELRQCTHYLIGSPAEIPGTGAPDQLIGPDMFSRQHTFYQKIVDDYVEQAFNQLPMSVINTEKIEDLAAATRQLLQCIAPTTDKILDMNGLIYYYGSIYRDYQIMYDMSDFFQRFASAEEFRIWKQTAEQAVIYKKSATSWLSSNHVNFSDFSVTDERYGGISMFIPLDIYDAKELTFNHTFRQTAWYYATGWYEYGW